MHRTHFLGGVVAFLLWSLPGAAGMYGLAIGVSHISETLPPIIFALLSGLNAATVGIIAVAAFQLSERAITNPITKAIVTSTGGAGILYNALWYFPLLMSISGAIEVTWEVGGGRTAFLKVRSLCYATRRASVPEVSPEIPLEVRSLHETSAQPMRNPLRNTGAR